MSLTAVLVVASLGVSLLVVKLRQIGVRYSSASILWLSATICLMEPAVYLAGLEIGMVPSTIQNIVVFLANLIYLGSIQFTRTLRDIRRRGEV